MSRRRPDDHAAFRLLAAAAVDGWIDSFDAADLESHLATCPACRAYTDAMRADHAWLASPARTLLPDPHVRAAVLGAARSPRIPRTSAVRRPWPSLAAAAVVVSVVAGGLLFLGRAALPFGSTPTTSPTHYATDGFPVVNFTGRAIGRDETFGSLDLRVSVVALGADGDRIVEISLNGEEAWSGTVTRADFGHATNVHGPYATAFIEGCRAGTNPCQQYRLLLVDDSDKPDEIDEILFWLPQPGATDPPDTTHRYQVVTGDIVVGFLPLPR